MNLDKKLIKVLARRVAAYPIDRFQILLGKHDKTYAGEFKTLEKILYGLGSPENMKFVDIGAGDGYNMSSAWPLSHYYSWTGLLVEPNIELLNRAKKFHGNSMNFCESSVTPVNLTKILELFEYGDAFYFKIDIDDFDLSLMRSGLENGFRPSIISIEINEMIPPPIRFETIYLSGAQSPRAPLFGCSIQSANLVAEEFGYFLHSLAYNNAFFVDTKYKGFFSYEKNLTLEEKYNQGFRDAGWQNFFPWDLEIKHWLEIDIDNLVNEIQSHRNFDPTRMIVA